MSNPSSLLGVAASMPQSLMAGFEATVTRRLGGNPWGDPMQNGGLLIVKENGNKVVLSHVQKGPADHVPNDKILEALGINDQ